MSVGTLSRNELVFTGPAKEEIKFLEIKHLQGARSRELEQCFLDRFGHPPSREQIEAVLQTNVRRHRKHKSKIRKKNLSFFRR